MHTKINENCNLHQKFLKMNKIYSLIALIYALITLTSCNNSGGDTPTYETRNRAEVYTEDITEIEAYLKAVYIKTVSDNDIVLDSIKTGTPQISVWNQTTYPLQNFTVKNDTRNTFKTDGRIDDNVNYKIYYLVLNEGGGSTPSAIDSTFVTYKGWNLKNKIFDQNFDGLWFTFPDGASSISGFRQILQKVKTAASSTQNSDGSISYLNYGRVMVFIPSGLAYFNTSTSNIDAYAPIAFNINLLKLKERDHDYDRIHSKNEDQNNDKDYFNDDTDGDGTPDFLDYDDDNDGFYTKREIRKPNIIPYEYYNFLEIPANTQGIKIHLDKTAKPN